MPILINAMLSGDAVREIDGFLPSLEPLLQNAESGFAANNGYILRKDIFAFIKESIFG